MPFRGDVIQEKTAPGLRPMPMSFAGNRGAEARLSGPSFPKAFHRSEGPSLARRSKQGLASGPPPELRAVASGSGDEGAARGSPQSRRRGGGGAAALQRGSEAALLDDISARNLEVVRGMSEAEVAASVAEVQSLFSEESLAFLRGGGLRGLRRGDSGGASNPSAGEERGRGRTGEGGGAGGDEVCGAPAWTGGRSAQTSHAATGATSAGATRGPSSGSGAPADSASLERAVAGLSLEERLKHAWMGDLGTSDKPTQEGAQEASPSFQMSPSGTQEGEPELEVGPANAFIRVSAGRLCR